MSGTKTRNLSEIPWLSLLPPDERDDLEEAELDAEAGEWTALVASDRNSWDDDVVPRSRAFRMVKSAGAGAALAGIFLALNAPGVTERGNGGRGAAPSTSRTVIVAVAEGPERNRAELASLAFAASEPSAAEPAIATKPRAGGKPSQPGAPAGPPPPSPPTGESPPLVSAKLPVVGDVTVPAPRVEVPELTIPELPPLPQLPQLPQPVLPPVSLEP